MATNFLYFFFFFFSVFPPAEQSLRTFHIIKDRMNLSGAQAACRINYTDLVTVYSDEDNTALVNQSNMAGISLPWIGLQRGQMTPKWSNGDESKFNKLTGQCDSNEPCCAAMNADGAWDNLECTQEKHFMCYKQDATDLSYYLITENKNWYEAQRYCRNFYTDLVSIRDQNQNEAVEMISITPFWIGLLSDDWEWTDGGRSAYRNWGTGQPLSSLPSSPPPDCVIMSAGKWISTTCISARPALCYRRPRVHVSNEGMSWEKALDYCKKENRTGLLRIDSDLDQKEVESELRRRNISGPLWVGLGQNRLSELLKSSSRLSLGPWTSWNGQPQSPLSLRPKSSDTVEKTFRQKTDISALRAVCVIQ